MKTFKEWFEGRSHGIRPIPSMLREDYEAPEGDILHFWYLCNEDSPRVLNFIAGLEALIDMCFPDEKHEEQTLESRLNPYFVHRHIRITESE